ncbi:unnamed protein product, partial [Closterium sp. NIES-54]
MRLQGVGILTVRKKRQQAEKKTTRDPNGATGRSSIEVVPSWCCRPEVAVRISRSAFSSCSVNASLGDSSLQQLTSTKLGRTGAGSSTVLACAFCFNADAPPDASPVESPDIWPDVSPDASTESSLDEFADVTGDVTGEVTGEVTTDASPDLPPDASADTFVDLAGSLLDAAESIGNECALPCNLVPTWFSSFCSLPSPLILRLSQALATRTLRPCALQLEWRKPFGLMQPRNLNPLHKVEIPREAMATAERESTLEKSEPGKLKESRHETTTSDTNAGAIANSKYLSVEVPTIASLSKVNVYKPFSFPFWLSPASSAVQSPPRLLDLVPTRLLWYCSPSSLRRQFEERQAAFDSPIMISQFFILSPRGDSIIFRDYRCDVPKTSPEIFFRKFRFWKGDNEAAEEAPPIFNLDGVNYLYIKCSGLLFVATARGNVSPSFVLELLQRIARVAKDYLGILNEESLRKNFVLVYELLDEMMDFGYPQSMSTEALKAFVFNESVPIMDSSPLPGGVPGSGMIVPPALGGAAASLFMTGGRNRVPGAAMMRSVVAPDTGVKKREEVFVDVIERLSVTFSPNGYILTCEIDGTIQMKSYLTANPEVRIALNEDLVIGQRNAPASLLYGGGGGMGEDGSGGFGIVVLDDCNFHESVRLDTFDVDRTMTLVPPDGEFSVINYRMTHEFKPPFRVYPVLEEITPFKVELFIKLKAEFPATATANSIVVRVPLPKSVIKVSCDLDPGAVGQSTDFKDASKILEWTIKKMPGGGNEHTCRAKMTLNQERGSGNMKKETGPISLSFNIPMYNASRLQVRSVDEIGGAASNKVRMLPRDQPADMLSFLQPIRMVKAYNIHAPAHSPTSVARSEMLLLKGMFLRVPASKLLASRLHFRCSCSCESWSPESYPCQVSNSAHRSNMGWPGARHRSSQEELLSRVSEMTNGEGNMLGNSDFELSVPENLNTMSASLASRLAKVVKEAALEAKLHEERLKPRPSRKTHWLEIFRDYIYPGQLILPGNRFHWYWRLIVIVMALYSSLITPFEFAFFRLKFPPLGLLIMDIVSNVIFLADIFITFRVAVKDHRTGTLIADRRRIAIRYLQAWFTLDFLSCIPWEYAYQASGHLVFEILLWLRLIRARHLKEFADRLGKDTRYHYFLVRCTEMFLTEFYVVHSAACIMYFLALTMPEDQSGYTWIGSLQLGDQSYADFREMNIFQLYCVSLYWAMVTMASLGYGDVHPVNPREMIFTIAFVVWDMLFTAYLIANFTALVVRYQSRSEILRERLSNVTRYANRKQIPAGMKEQLLSHVVLKQEALEEDNKLVNEFPISIRDGVAMSLHGKVLADAYLFQGCSKAFIQFLVSRLRVEYFLPGEVVVSRHDNNHQLYLLVQGEVEEVHFSRNGARVATVWSPGEMFGEAGLLASKFSPFTAHVKSFCKLLRIDGQVFSEAIAFHQEDGERIISNYLQKFGLSESEPLDFGQPRAHRLTDTAEEVRRAVTQRQAQQTLSAIQQAARGDLDHLKMLRKLGADFSKGDFDGRTALHLAASRGFPDICSFILREGGAANRKDRFGVTPLLEALRAGHMQTAEVLREHGAQILLDDPASELCHAVKRGMVEYLERLLSFGLDPNEADHDLRTPLHVAAAEGSVVLVRLLLEHGADAWARDRLGHLPVDEACRNGARPVIALLKDGMRVKLPPLASRPPAGRASLTRGVSQRRRHTHHQPSSSNTGAPAATATTASTTTGTTKTTTSNTATSNTASTPRHSQPSRRRSHSVDTTWSDQIESVPEGSSSGAASPSTCLPSDPLLQQRVMHLRRRPTSSVHIPSDLLADLLPGPVIDEYSSEHQTDSHQPLFTPPASPLMHSLPPKLHAAASLSPATSYDGSELQPRASSATFLLSEPYPPSIPDPHATHAEHTAHTAPYRSASAALPPVPPAPGIVPAPHAQRRPTPLTINPLDRSFSRSSTAPHSSLDEVRTQLIPASPEPSTHYATSQPLSGPLGRVGEPITPYPHRNYVPAGSFSGSFRALPPPPTPSVAVANRRVTVFPCRPWDTGQSGKSPEDSSGEVEPSEGAHGRQPRECSIDQAVHSAGESASPEPGREGGAGSRAGEEKPSMGRPYGKVVLVPLFMVTLIEQLSTLFGFSVRILVNKDGGEITDTDTIRDGDVIFAPPSEPALS